MVSTLLFKYPGGRPQAGGQRPRRCAAIVVAALLATPVPALDLAHDGGGAAVGPAILFENGPRRLMVVGTELRALALSTDADGQPVLLYHLSDVDAAAFASLTSGLVGKPLEVSICGRVLMKPVLRAAITSGAGVIPMTTVRQATQLLEALKGEGPCPPLD